MRARFLTCLALAALLAAASAHADKLKGFYTGSGGMSAEVHRVVMVEFAEDGTALVQQNWAGRDPQTWHARWAQQGKQVTLTFDPQKDSPPVAPLVVNIKHGALVPATWDSAALGALGPPTLAPFGPKNVLRHSVASCVSINSADPTNDCVTWDSRNPHK